MREEQPEQPEPSLVTGKGPGIAVRASLVVLGAAAMIASPFLQWAGDPQISVTGTELGMDVFWSAEPTLDPGFFASAGLAAVVIGLIALIGLAPGARAFSVLGGALGVAAAVLVAVSAIRGGLGFENLRVGLYLLFLGGLMALIGGLLPPTKAGDASPAAPPRRPPADPPPPA